ncbi:5-formyltetrahydrofolate cyclo-ligase [Nocardioides sp. IC4_145]|uniref:5-formyltetrahydrofolate cyclo-ligase n=1 Tax=Nocardioides sp. IC4_145 TaxID=2714037 RepID=UPI00140BF8E8|nr:5-formyltetrahydrofolate cyclo-ligase [Nocardioides sp. IC4_145]
MSDRQLPAKTALRDQVLAGRRRRPLLALGEGARATAEHLLATPEVRRAATVAAYVSIGTEPGTSFLLDALAAAGKRVLLPRLLPDGDLDWGTWRGEGSLAPARMGLLEPIDSLGVDAVATADAVLVPGLAVSPTGMRLGRGGGSYDRALARAVGTWTCVLLADEEVGLDVPSEPHDRAVLAAATPSGITRFRVSRPRRGPA